MALTDGMSIVIAGGGKTFNRRKVGSTPNSSESVYVTNDGQYELRIGQQTGKRTRTNIRFTRYILATDPLDTIKQTEVKSSVSVTFDGDPMYFTQDQPWMQSLISGLSTWMDTGTSPNTIKEKILRGEN